MLEKQLNGCLDGVIRLFSACVCDALLKTGVEILIQMSAVPFKHISISGFVQTAEQIRFLSQIHTANYHLLCSQLDYHGNDVAVPSSSSAEEVKDCQLACNRHEYFTVDCNVHKGHGKCLFIVQLTVPGTSDG